MLVFLLKTVENNVAIVGIARYQHAMSTFDTIFSKLSAAETPESVYMGETVNLCRFLFRHEQCRQLQKQNIRENSEHLSIIVYDVLKKTFAGICIFLYNIILLSRKHTLIFNPSPQTINVQFLLFLYAFKVVSLIFAV